MNEKSWEFTMGFYPGIVIGIRSYPHKDSIQHVFYLPFVDICLEVFKD